MNLLPVCLIQAVLLSAAPGGATTVHVTDASVQYRVEERTFGTSPTVIVGRNGAVSLDLRVTPGAVSGKLLISSSKFKSDVPLRDVSVRMILQYFAYPDIEYEIQTINGDDLATDLRPVGDGLVLTGDLHDLTFALVPADGGLRLRSGKSEARVEGKLKEAVEQSLRTGSGTVTVTGKLTIRGKSKTYESAVSIARTGASVLSLTAPIEAKFTDFGMSPPNVGVVLLTTPDKISLEGDALITLSR